MKSMDHQIRTIVKKRYSPPTITIKGVQLHKLEDKWDENKMKTDSFNAKALTCIVS